MPTEQSKIEEQLESQQKEAFRAIKMYMDNMHHYLHQCNTGKFPSLKIGTVGTLIKQFEGAANIAKSIITRHFAQRVVANAYRKDKKDGSD